MFKHNKDDQIFNLEEDCYSFIEYSFLTLLLLIPVKQIHCSIALRTLAPPIKECKREREREETYKHSKGWMKYKYTI